MDTSDKQCRLVHTPLPSLKALDDEATAIGSHRYPRLVNIVGQSLVLAIGGHTLSLKGVFRYTPLFLGTG